MIGSFKKIYSFIISIQTPPEFYKCPECGEEKLLTPENFLFDCSVVCTPNSKWGQIYLSNKRKYKLDKCRICFRKELKIKRAKREAEWQKELKHRRLFKRCNKCNKEKPRTVEFFHREKQRRDGLSSQCRNCRKKSDQVRRAFEKIRKNAPAPYCYIRFRDYSKSDLIRLICSIK